MTISEANAANEVASELLILAATGAKITPAMEHGIGILLINSNKILTASPVAVMGTRVFCDGVGFDATRFLGALAKVRSAIGRESGATLAPLEQFETGARVSKPSATPFDFAFRRVGVVCREDGHLGVGWEGSSRIYEYPPDTPFARAEAVA